jgi:hypothetical protein
LGGGSTPHTPRSHCPPSYRDGVFPMLEIPACAAGGFWALKCSHNLPCRLHFCTARNGRLGPGLWSGWSGSPPDAVYVFPSATQGAHPPATGGSCVCVPTQTDRAVKAVLMRRSLSSFGTLPMKWSRLAGESSREPGMVAVRISLEGPRDRIGQVTRNACLGRTPAGS